MGIRKNFRKPDQILESQKKDENKIFYMFFQRGFWIEDIEHYFEGKYSYKEIKNIIRSKINGR